jgi:hypothetical protein
VVAADLRLDGAVMTSAPVENSALEKRSGPIRMAFRREGEFVNCYLARTGTMVGAELLGSMRSDFLDANPEAWEGWQQIMADVLAKIVRLAAPGAPFEVEAKDAPAHELVGRA